MLKPDGQTLYNLLQKVVVKHHDGHPGQRSSPLAAAGFLGRTACLRSILRCQVCIGLRAESIRP